MTARRTVITKNTTGSPSRFNRSNLGFSPADTMSNVQVSVSGMLGGSYAVEYVPVGTSHIIVFEENVTEANMVLMAGDKPLYEEIRVVFTNLGAGAEPEIAVTFWREGL